MREMERSYYTTYYDLCKKTFTHKYHFIMKRSKGSFDILCFIHLLSHVIKVMCPIFHYKFVQNYVNFFLSLNKGIKTKCSISGYFLCTSIYAFDY